MNTERNVKNLAEGLMKAVARMGVIRRGFDNDYTVAARVMREELKAFLFDAKYTDERELVKTGGHNLAMASVVAECGRRILAERLN